LVDVQKFALQVGAAVVTVQAFWSAVAQEALVAEQLVASVAQPLLG
jgi:hypothetical protein